jgi:hypothetical protein
VPPREQRTEKSPEAASAEQTLAEDLGNAEIEPEHPGEAPGSSGADAARGSDHGRGHGVLAAASLKNRDELDLRKQQK